MGRGGGGPFRARRRRPSACAGLRAGLRAAAAPIAVASWLELSLAGPDAGAAPAPPPFELRVAPPLALAADAAQELRALGRGDRKRRAPPPPPAAAPAAAPRVVCVPSRAAHRQRWRCEAAAAAVDEVSVLRVSSPLTELLTLGRAAAGHVWRSVAEADGADGGGGGSGSVQYSVELHGDGALRVLLAEGGRADGSAHRADLPRRRRRGGAGRPRPCRPTPPSPIRPRRR